MADLISRDNALEFGKNAQGYDAYRPDYLPEQVRGTFAKLSLGEHSVVADIGAGTGKLTRLIPEVGRVYCVEPDAGMLEKCMATMQQSSNKNTCISMQSKSHNTRIPDHSVDVIIAADSSHWFDPQPTLREFQRILKPDGKLVIFNHIPYAGAENGAVINRLHELLLQHCPKYNKRGTNWLDRTGERMYSQPQKHFMAPGTGTQDIIIQQLQWGEEELYGFLSTVSSTLEWAKSHKDQAMNKVVRPIIKEFGTAGKINVPWAHRVAYGSIAPVRQPSRAP